MKHPEVACGRCEGTGCVPLHPAALQTLRLLPDVGRGVTAPWLAKRLGIKATAANQRLESLRSLGLAKRLPGWNGKAYEWRRAP